MSTVLSARALPAVLLLLSLGGCDAAPSDPPSGAAAGEADSGSGDSGQADPGPVDADGDGVSVDDDCDDTRADTYPGAYETCDDVDNDCDGEVDEGLAQSWWTDADGDGWGDRDFPLPDSCHEVSGAVNNATDCDDTDRRVRFCYGDVTGSIGRGGLNPCVYDVVGRAISPGDCADCEWRVKVAGSLAYGDFCEAPFVADVKLSDSAGLTVDVTYSGSTNAVSVESWSLTPEDGLEKLYYTGQYSSQDTWGILDMELP